jgi:hypothetical protein
MAFLSTYLHIISFCQPNLIYVFISLLSHSLAQLRCQSQEPLRRSHFFGLHLLFWEPEALLTLAAFGVALSAPVPELGGSLISILTNLTSSLIIRQSNNFHIESLYKEAF